MNKKEGGYQWCWARIDELMLGASWHYHEVSSFDILIFTRNGGFAGSSGEGQDLVDEVSLGETAVSPGTVVLRRLKPALKRQERTSSPTSPPTGTVMSTTCEYKPVQTTLRKSLDVDGRDEFISGK